MAQEAQGEDRRQAYLAKAEEEISRLRQMGVTLVGNAFPLVLFAKGEPNEQERAEPERLLAGEDGRALRASLARLGYPPEAWAAVLTCAADGAPLGTELFRLVVTTIDPDTLVLCDEAAADLAREAYADDLALVQDLDKALLAPGVLVHLRGMRVMDLGGFETALSDDRQKQIMWARLKRIPPLGEPF